MAKKIKTLCKLVKKDILKDDPARYLALVRDAKFYCKKCGRVANEDELVCKSGALNKD